MDRRVTPPKRVTSPTWGSPPPYKQALSLSFSRTTTNSSSLKWKLRLLLFFTQIVKILSSFKLQSSLLAGELKRGEVRVTDTKHMQGMTYYAHHQRQTNITVNCCLMLLYLDNYSGFQVKGMIAWQQKSKPKKIPRVLKKTTKKSLDQKLTSQKSHAAFPSLHFPSQKALTDITQIPVT